MIAYETISYGEGRARVRHDQVLPAEPPWPASGDRPTPEQRPVEVGFVEIC